jgi:hypothetical protein
LFNLMLGTGLGLLGWIVTSAVLLAFVASTDDKPVDGWLDTLSHWLDGITTPMVLAPSVIYTIWALVKGRTLGLGYCLGGMCLGLASPFMALLVFFLVCGIPHA